MCYLAAVFQFLADSQKSLCFLVGALRGRVFTLSREVTVVCLRHRDCQAAQSDFGLCPRHRLRGRRSTVVGKGLQGERLMHVSLCDVLVNSVVGNKDRVVGSVRSWLSVYGLHVVTDIRKQCGTALDKILVGEAKCRECRLQLRIVRSGSLQRVRKSDDQRTGGGGVRGGVRWRALLRRCDLRSRDVLAGLGSSASKHQKEKGLDQEGLDQEGLDQEGLDQEGLDQEGLDQEDPDRHGPSHSGAARSRFSHTPQHLCPSHGNPVIAGIDIDRVTRSRLKRSERRIKLCSESGYSKRWLG